MPNPIKLKISSGLLILLLSACGSNSPGTPPPLTKVPPPAQKIPPPKQNGPTPSPVPPANGTGSKSQTPGSPSNNTTQSTPTAASSTDVTKAQKGRVIEKNGVKVFEYLETKGHAGTWHTYGRVEILPKGTQLHHWGPKKDVAHWATHGIQAQDIDQAVRRYDPYDVIGGGFYVSLDTLDSSDYGPSLIIAEVENDVTTLNVPANWTYLANSQELYDYTTQMKIPVPLIAEAGIETLRYRDNWMVCIRGNPLTKLFEGNWENYALRYGGKNFDYKRFLQFEAKYPLNQADIKGPKFTAAFPLIARSLNGDHLTPEELDALREVLIPGVNPILAPIPYVSSSSLTKSLFSLVTDHAAYLQSLIRRINKGNQPGGLEDQLVKPLTLSTLKIEPKFTLYPYDLFRVSLLNTKMLKTSVFDSQNTSLMTHMNFYEFLNNTLNGISMPPTSTSELPVTKTKLSGIVYSLSTDSLAVSTWEKLARSFRPDGDVFRSAPLLVTGLHFLNGLDKPGFFKLDETQVEELRQNVFLKPVFAQKEDLAGKLEHYVYYEAPSLNNAENFLTLLNQPDLSKQILAAQQAGHLNDASSKEFRALHQELMKAVLDYVLKTYKSPRKIISLLTKLLPFQDTQLNDRVLLLAYSTFLRSDVFFPDPNILRTASYVQLVDHSVHFPPMINVLNRSLNLSKDPLSKINLADDIGYWEIAANMPPPHMDDRSFIDKVSARFKSAEVQKYLVEQRSDLIMQALHEAGAGQ